MKDLQVMEDLQVLESKYGMDSETFYRKYQAGETDDRMDFVEWASLVQMAENLKERLALLDGEGVDFGLSAEEIVTFITEGRRHSEE